MSIPYRCKLTRTLPHFRVEERAYAGLLRIAKKYDMPTSELCRMAVDQLVKADWPKVLE